MTQKRVNTSWIVANNQDFDQKKKKFNSTHIKRNTLYASKTSMEAAYVKTALIRNDHPALAILSLLS